MTAADHVLIYYSTGGTNTSSVYNHLKSELEDSGFTVTGSTRHSKSSDLIGKELVIDIAGSPKLWEVKQTTKVLLAAVACSYS